MGSPPAHDLLESWSESSQIHQRDAVPQSQFIKELEALEAGTAAGSEFHSTGKEELLAEEAAEIGRLERAARSLNAENRAEYFTDYFKARLHSKSAQLLRSAWHEESGLVGWSSTGDWTYEQAEEAADAIRFFAEECDSLEGFQCFVDDISHWGPISAEVLQNIRDDYGHSKMILLFALRSSFDPNARDSAEGRRRYLCEGLSTSMLTKDVDIFVPVSAPIQESDESAALRCLSWPQGSIFHESALCAAALDGATLPYRIHPSQRASYYNGYIDARGLVQLLTSQYGVNLGALSLSMPFKNVRVEPVERDPRVRHGNDVSEQHNRSLSYLTATSTLSGPGIGGFLDQDRFAESIVVRGPRSEGRPLSSIDAASYLDICLNQEGSRCLQRRSYVCEPLQIPLPFPNIFRSKVGQFGDVDDGSPTDVHAVHAKRVTSCPIMTRLSGTAAFGDGMTKLKSNFAAAAASIEGRAMLQSWAVDKELQTEVMERLMDLADLFRED